MVVLGEGVGGLTTGHCYPETGQVTLSKWDATFDICYVLLTNRAQTLVVL